MVKKAKRVAIIQSNYIPWKGYFDMIGMADEFIIYDEVQYTKNDWRNRNRIKTSNGVQWITIPVYQKHLNQKISETRISDKFWAAKHWKTLKTNYSRARYFSLYRELFEEFYKTTNSVFLSETNRRMIGIIATILGLRTRITSSADYILDGDPTERLVSLCRQSGASAYITGPAARNYLDDKKFADEHIAIEWMDYNGYQEYPQLYPPFEHAVSIVDLIFNVGPEALQFLKCKDKYRQSA